MNKETENIKITKYFSGSEKNKLSESKNSLHRLNNRLDTIKDNISEFEDSMLKLSHGEGEKN